MLKNSVRRFFLVMLMAIQVAEVATAAGEPAIRAVDNAGFSYKVVAASPITVVVGIAAPYLGLARITSSSTETVRAKVSFAVCYPGTVRVASGFELSSPTTVLRPAQADSATDIPFAVERKHATPGQYDVHVIVEAAGQSKSAIFADVSI